MSTFSNLGHKAPSHIDRDTHSVVGFFVLQTLRVFTVITLAVTAAACWALIIKVEMYRPYFVFQCISLFFTSIGCVFLIIAELPFIRAVKDFYQRTWPVLSDEHGIGWMGLAIIIIGAHVVGSLNQKGYDTDTFNDHFFKLVAAAGILCIIFGSLNIIGALIWRNAKQGTNSRIIRAQGNMTKEALPSYSPEPSSLSSLRNEKRSSRFMFWKPKPEDNSEARPIISGPFRVDSEVEEQDARTSPIVPGIKRPDTALHPMHLRHVSSQYSVANMSRFG